ncbi:hypothetical protein [uncultured Zobellia sp.]|uniref:hypothetical protein n=1 Tax=uncultured Zobellia sp. TaxID=255433 RepID=UPI002599F34D|nr:hypothetical protein [uncultured Zobellia sp.]
MKLSKEMLEEYNCIVCGVLSYYPNEKVKTLYEICLDLFDMEYCLDSGFNLCDYEEELGELFDELFEEYEKEYRTSNMNGGDTNIKQ